MGCSFSCSSSKSRKDLANDIWYEIFLYLPLNSIFKLKCVSKVWFSLLSNPIFIKQWYKINSSSLPWALAYNVVLSETDEEVTSSRFDYAYPDCLQSGFSFRFLNWANTNLTKNKYRILGSSNGLVLCSAWLCDDEYRPYQVGYYVCNPLTKKWVSLPASPRNNLFLVTAFICDECLSSSLSSASYKVVCIPDFGRADVFDIEIFSSDSGKWVSYRVSCPEAVTWKHTINSLITQNGVIYWNVKGKKILVYDCYNNGTAGNYECRLIDLPGEEEEEVWDVYVFIKYGLYRCRSLGESEGFICYAILNKERATLSVWVLEDDWRLLHKDIELQDTLTEMNQLCGWNRSGDQIQLLGLNPQDQNIVLLGWCDFPWAYNIQTGRSEKLSHPSFSPKLHSFESPNLMIPFVVKPRPTKIPPKSWIDY